MPVTRKTPNTTSGASADPGPRVLADLQATDGWTQEAIVGHLKALVSGGWDALETSKLRHLEVVKASSAASYPTSFRDALRSVLIAGCKELLDPGRLEIASICLGLGNHARGLTANQRYEVAAQEKFVPKLGSRNSVQKFIQDDLIPSLACKVLQIEHEYKNRWRGKSIVAVTWSDFARYAGYVVTKTRNLGEQALVVGIARGGLPLAVYMSHHLPCESFGVASVWKYRAPGSDHANVHIEGLILPKEAPGSIVVTSDVITHGRTVRAVVEKLESVYGEGKVAIVVATLFADMRIAEDKTIKWAFGQIVDSETDWIRFPWETVPKARPDAPEEKSY